MSERGRVIRDRLVGTAVLVLAALAFLPMLRDEDGVQPEVSIEPLPRFERVELPPFAEDAPQWAFEQELQDMRTELDARDTRIGHVRLVTPAEDGAEAGGAPGDASELDQLGAFAVQVGSFRSAERALEQRDRLAADGVHAFISQARDAKGPINRVVVGPHVSRAEADGFAIQMRARYGLEAFVVEVQP